MRLLVQPVAVSEFPGTTKLLMFVAVSNGDTGEPISGLIKSQFQVAVGNVGSLPVSISDFIELKLEPDKVTKAGVYTFNLKINTAWFIPGVSSDIPIAVQVRLVKQNGPWVGQGVALASWTG